MLNRMIACGRVEEPGWVLTESVSSSWAYNIQVSKGDQEINSLKDLV